MLQKQAIYTILVSLTVVLTACDSSKQSETDADSKSSVFKTEQAEVLPYLNIQQQAADIAQPFCETKNCIELDLQSLTTADPWLNQWIAKSQARVIQDQIGLKQDMNLQQAI
ncbi:MAG: hypothetical protein L0G73_09845, partial [Acinetobacter sp.]|nr:hypothetical protein [Acinetobacter sp.]